MRLLVLVSLIGLGLMHAPTLLELAREGLGRGDGPEVVAALELRCGDAAGLEQRHCEEDLRKAFSSGERDASDIVRLHCTRFDNGWADQQAQHEVCTSLQES